MNNSETLTQQAGERLSFYKLLVEKKYHIEIPIIQRDYAQGRKSTKEVREVFLDTLYKYLEEGKPNRDLDFVYGSVTTNGVTKLIPLDGQQRLTTLFLLHWYLAIQSGNIESFKQDITFKNVSKFTYETRTSSKEFCDAILMSEIDLNNLLLPDKNKQNSLSKTIKDAEWYFLSWDNDPTIQSMLNMLDAIHNKFFNKPEFYKLLIDTENPVITFLFLSLDTFKLTDDLYIKMNSRGKPLTAFETFKAKLEQQIESLEWDTTSPYFLIFDNQERSATVKEYFSYKIDTEWANLFWNYRDISTSDDTFDDEMMNFFRVIFSNQRAIDSQNEKDDALEFLIGTQTAKQREDYTNNISFHRYQAFNVLTVDSISYLIESLDYFSQHGSQIKPLLTETFFYDEKKVFEQVLKNELTLTERVRFHAYVKYLIVNKTSSGLSDWMRVVYNLTENSIIDGADEVAKAIKSVEKMLPKSLDILNCLTDESFKIDFFYQGQVFEERIKAHLLLKQDPIWTNAILESEKHAYFNGQIGFLIDFSGILSYYKEHGDINCESEQDNIYQNNFLEYSKDAGIVFNVIKDRTIHDFAWERAVLTKGNYLIPASSNRYNLLNTNRFLRDYSWRRLLRLHPNSTNGSDQWQDKRNFVKAVFDDENFHSDNLQASLENICQTIPEDWRKHFILHPRLIHYCEQGFINFENSQKITLFRQSQMNHKHREFYSYSLCLTGRSEMKDYLPFKQWNQLEVKSRDEWSIAVLEDCCINRIYYEVQVYFDTPGEESFLKSPYQLRFVKSKGAINLSDYPDDIQNVLKLEKFSWYTNQDWLGFWISKDTEEEALEVIKSLAKRLNDIKSC